MAITKIHAIKSTLGKALAYIENPDKTDGQMLVSGYNCEPQTASIDFEMTAVLAHKTRNLKRKRFTNLAYHLIQSFSPEDAVTPEQAHELGKKLAFEYTGGKYEYVVATHIDKGHIHNHIMLNAVSFYDYKKLRTVPYRTARQIRDISDRLCMEAHLSVIDNPQTIGQLYPENAGKKKSVSNRTEIRTDKTRYKDVKVRIPEEELAVLNCRVAKTGMSREQYIRCLIADTIPAEYPPADYRLIIRKLDELQEVMEALVDENPVKRDAMKLYITLQNVASTADVLRRAVMPFVSRCEKK